MDTLSFPKAKVLKALRASRDEHRQIVKEAQEGYRAEAIKTLSEKLRALKAGESVNPNVHLNVPISHIDDIDRAIEMLEMSKGAEVVLSEHEFQCYVRGKWEWENQFLVGNSNYSAMALNKLGGGVKSK